jgi:hypothetical protein
MCLLQVTVSDNGTPALSSTTRVVVAVSDVNDNAPVFEQMYYKVTIPESSNLDVPLFQVGALLFAVLIPQLTFGILIFTQQGVYGHN